ncbi:hypothetical protein GCM10011351_15720 [Paraliobacillus quinghaiensis]|uniref:HPr family phosphocarrier protein n=1 Tax=Paraliobacillus quinghaiensis TaxID=470815 RepID=A0A917TPE8_9BACI|nr:HPr family phosphocarrier protein [Paraliobacillus quinghaiensis]GGM30426.1 hypothetical protein GCM10011351_15720 [Paraliobacillus quinghaiensis]
MIIPFQFKEKDDVVKLNKIATNYSFDIWIHNDDQMVDAKTILALYTLPFNKELKLVFDNDVNSRLLVEEMRLFVKRRK